MGFLSKIAPFHAFGIFIEDGPISRRMGFLIKMAAFQYANAVTVYTYDFEVYLCDRRSHYSLSVGTAGEN